MMLESLHSESARKVYGSLPLAFQNLACTIAGYNRRRERLNSHFARSLNSWEQTLSCGEEHLLEIQRRRLCWTVEAARAHVPHYKSVPPPSKHRDPRTCIAETLGQIQPTEKEQYREDPKAFLSRKIRPRDLLVGQTSGTTGTALPLFHTRRTLGEEYASVWRHRRLFGIRLSDPHHTFNGQRIVPYRNERPPFFRSNRASNQTLFSIYHLRPENLRHYVDALHNLPGTYAEGYPSALHVVARALLDTGRPLNQGHLKAVFTSSESLLAFQRDDIATAFGAPVHDRYGASEFAVSMTECSEHRLHVDMEFCVVEVEPTFETEEYVRGPLLVTGFANDATPLLRYRIGDIGTKSKRSCPCGRSGDVFESIDGRREDYVVTRDGRLVGRLDHVFKELFDVREAQIIQESRECLRVLVVASDSYNTRSEAQLLRELRSRVGDELSIVIDKTESIPREPNGKFRAVRSQLDKASNPTARV